MSVGTVVLECDGCGASFSRGVLYGDFWYQMPNGNRYPLDRALGWCNFCALMVAVEDLSGDRVNEEIKRAETWKYEAEQKLKRSLFSKLFGDEKARIARCDQELKMLRDNLAFLRARTSPSRCLDCGSSDIVILPTPPWPEDVGVDVPAGWNHPLCGGRMVAKALPGRLHFSYPPRVFNEHGVSITSECD